MSEWKEWNGSDEQIAEIESLKNGVIFRYMLMGQIVESRIIHSKEINSFLFDNKYPVAYLICNPHPLADMICQQVRTGQPVWVRKLFECGIEKEWQMFVTTTPDWNIPNAEYSFTEFKEEVCR